MKETKNLQTQERQAYVPASVKVIEITAQKVMCTSPSSVNNPFGGSEEPLS